MKLRKKAMMRNGVYSILLVLCLLGLLPLSDAADKPIPTASLPLVVTTCGQSPGALMVKVICDKNKMPCDQNDLLKADQLAAKAKEGKPYKTVIITMGTSLKGMGAAGIDINLETSRIKAVIEEAKKQQMLIIGAHIEGKARRVDDTDYASISAVVPNSALLIIRRDGNEDGFFTKLAEKHGIPLIEIKETLDLGDTLKKLFKM